MLKEVNFTLCFKCKHVAKRETEDPCYECLSIPAREDSHTPLRFEAKDNIKKDEVTNNG